MTWMLTHERNSSHKAAGKARNVVLWDFSSFSFNSTKLIHEWENKKKKAFRASQKIFEISDDYCNVFVFVYDCWLSFLLSYMFFRVIYIEQDVRDCLQFL